MNTTKNERALRDTATEWFVRLQSDALTEQEKQHFFAWLHQSDQHQRAYIEVERFWDSLSLLENSAQASVSASQAKRKRPMLAYALAACITLFMVGTIAYLNLFTFGHEYVTQVGEQHQWLLDDGSKITLNTDSSLRLAFNDERRLVKLERGEAFFEVAKDAQRPFIVHTEHGIVRVLGTQFSVHQATHGSVVTVLEGRVGVTAESELESASQSNYTPDFTLTPNQQTVLSKAQPSAEITAVDAASRIAWREGKLVYRGESFASVLADINRYYPGEIRAGDERLAQLKVAGVFQLNDKAATLRALEDAFQLAAVNASDELTLLYPKK